MGKQLLDQYTYLHFAVGVIVYYWGIKLSTFMLIHTLFELTENIEYGMFIINKYLTIWPGGKPYADSSINIIGDSIGAYLGWMSAYYLDTLGNKFNWYKKHILIL